MHHGTPEFKHRQSRSGISPPASYGLHGVKTGKEKKEKQKTKKNQMPCGRDVLGVCQALYKNIN
jgi:hypothetical protein